jgi:hypothetical protein
MEMAYKVSEYAGVTGQVAGVLKSLGIADSEQLLMLVTDPAQRVDLLNKMGVDDRFLADLTERADLTRVPGIGPAFAQLLSQAGIRSVPELARANPTQLLDTLTKTAATFGVKRIPTAEDLNNWVAGAGRMTDVTTWSTNNRVAALKGQLAEDEWTKVRLAPMAAAAMVMLASPSKGSDAEAEHAAAAAVLNSARQGGPAWSLLNVAFDKNISAADLEKFMQETPPAAMASTIKAAVAAVAAKDPAEAAAYRDTLMKIANGVAEAASEGGFLGMGKKLVSEQEQAALAEIANALK